MAKLTLTDLTNLENQSSAIATISANNALIENAMELTLSRDGTSPNTMTTDLDMNSNSITNLPEATTGAEPVRKQEFDDAIDSLSSGMLALSNTGIVVSNAAHTVEYRTVTGTTGEVTVTNGSGVSGNPTISLPSALTLTGKAITGGTYTLPTMVAPTLGAAIATTINGMTIPVVTDTVVGKATTDTLTNKSIDASQLTGSVAAARMPALTGDVTTSAGAVATTIANNAVTNAKAAQAAAYTIKGNSTGSTANVTDISIPALTQKATPVSGDFLLIADSAASNALKYATIGTIAASGSIPSFGGVSGAISVGSNLEMSGSTLQDAAAFIGEIRTLAYNRLPANFLACDGTTVSRTTYASLYANLVVSSTVTITNASPGVVTWTSHSLQNGDPILLTTSGGLPTGLSISTKYYVKNKASNTFQLSATPGGAAINTSSAGSGTHTGINAPWEGTAIGNGTTTFTLPALNGYFIRGIDNGASAAADLNRSFGTIQLDAAQGHIHTIPTPSNAGTLGTTGGSGVFYYTTTGTTNTSSPLTDGSNGTPRTAAETRPSNQALLYIIRYQ